jgi:hypothetical protein
MDVLAQWIEAIADICVTLCKYTTPKVTSGSKMEAKKPPLKK